MTEVTRYLDQLVEGDEHSAERLLDLVYGELRLLTTAKLAREAANHTLQAIQRVQAGGQDVLIVRMGDTSTAASTLYIDWESGRLRRVDSMPTVEGMGRLGQQSTFGDFREIEGMLLPFSVTSKMAHPLIGTIEVTIEDYELGPEVPPGCFQLQDLP